MGGSELGSFSPRQHSNRSQGSSLAFLSRWAPPRRVAYFDPKAPPRGVAYFEPEAPPSGVAGFDFAEGNAEPLGLASSSRSRGERPWFRSR